MTEQKYGNYVAKYAVMQQRKSSRAKTTIDYYPTPPWATEFLMKWLVKQGYLLSDMQGNGTCLEPAAGGGHMVNVLQNYFTQVDASDLHDPANMGYPREDFLLPFSEKDTHDFIITNPPFVLAEEFTLKALERARVGVCMICRIAFLEGGKRYNNLFKTNPPNHVCVFVNRVAMVKGRYDPKASSATCYAWFIWMRGEQDTQVHWLTDFAT